MIWLAAVGFASGVISGMGIGGGTLLIPALVIIFGFSQTDAQKINLIYFIPTAAVALTVHLREGNVEKKLVPRLMLPGLLAAAAGSLVAVNIDADLLRRIFGGFLLIMGITEFLKKEE